VRASNDQTQYILKELETSVQESCRLQEEIAQLKKRLRDLIVVGQFTQEDQMKVEIERLTREVNAVNIEKSDLIVANQSLQMLLDEKQHPRDTNDLDVVFKCNVNAVMLDILFTIVSERRKQSESVLANFC